MTDESQHRGFRLEQRYVRLVHFVLDAAVWAVAIPITTFLRYDFTVAPIDRRAIAAASIVAIAFQGLFGFASGLYRRRFRYASFDEAAALAATVALAGAAVYALLFAWDDITLPRSVPMLAAVFMLSGALVTRGLWRQLRQHRRRPGEARPLIVLGAGEGAVQVIQALLGRSDSPYLPVALLDDDPLKRNLRIQGVRVIGGLRDLVDVAERAGARSVLMAMPSADSSLIRMLADEAARANLEFLVLPGLAEMFGNVSVSDIRPVAEEDLLGRHPADIDPDAVADYVTDKRVLVTGAGGSIGSELCRQLARFEPRSLIMLDRDESGLHAVQLSIEGRALLDNPDLVLADIRDAWRLDEVFARYRPHVVFHAAALKHLTLLESAPAEAWKTNVLGTQSVLAAARANGVERFVNISTDKAANPTSVLGYSKRITERLTAQMASSAEGTYVSVRFGNVLGSRGSVLTAFRAQAAVGGPITVTHPDVTRYFMTIEEAARLTVYAGAIGRSGEVLVLDMGQPVKIVDVARRFASQHRPPLDIVFTGLRPGEKLHEDLIADDEIDKRPIHSLITHVGVAPLSLEEAERACRGTDSLISVAGFERAASRKSVSEPSLPRNA